jgi:hypothetical protein
VSDWRITRDGHYTPVITKSEDGTLTLDWPDGTPNTCVVAKEMMVQLVDSLNLMRSAVATLEAEKEAKK